MKPRYIIFTILCFFIHIFNFYYILAFNIIYEKSSISWIQSAIIGWILDWFVLEIGTQFVQAGFRSLAMKYPKL